MTALLIFKLTLALALAAVGYLFVFRVRSRLLNRVLVAAVIGTMVVFVAVPELSTRVARVFGIGRGADLLFYTAHACVALLVTLLYVRIQELSARITQLSRAVSLLTAQSPKESAEK